MLAGCCFRQFFSFSSAEEPFSLFRFFPKSRKSKNKATTVNISIMTLYFRLKNIGVIFPVASDNFLLEFLKMMGQHIVCLLYTSDAADDLTRVDLGGRRFINKK